MIETMLKMVQDTLPINIYSSIFIFLLQEHHGEIINMTPEWNSFRYSQRAMCKTTFTELFDVMVYC